MTINITVERSSQGFLTRWRWQKVATEWTSWAGRLVTDEIRKEAPIGKKPGGRLRESIQHVGHVTSSSASVEVSSTAPYVSYVVHGTPPHVIQPIHASVLHWEEGGDQFYRRVVNHPGARANPFPERAMRAVEPLLKRRLREVVTDTMEGL